MFRKKFDSDYSAKVKLMKKRKAENQCITLKEPLLIISQLSTPNFHANQQKKCIQGNTKKQHTQQMTVSRHLAWQWDCPSSILTTQKQNEKNKEKNKEKSKHKDKDKDKQKNKSRYKIKSNFQSKIKQLSKSKIKLRRKQKMCVHSTSVQANKKFRNIKSLDRKSENSFITDKDSQMDINLMSINSIKIKNGNKSGYGKQNYFATMNIQEFKEFRNPSSPSSSAIIQKIRLNRESMHRKIQTRHTSYQLNKKQNSIHNLTQAFHHNA